MRQFKITSDDIPGAKVEPKVDCYLPKTDPYYQMAYAAGEQLSLPAFAPAEETDDTTITETQILKG